MRKTYLVNLGGKHIQFNVVDRNPLLDAKENPDKYKSLVVRVAGYSALCIEPDRVCKMRSSHGVNNLINITIVLLKGA